MKNKIKLLGLISALAIGATMTFTACGDGSVGEHDHVWGEPVTTESTCYKEGTITYTCSVEGCTQKKSEPIAMIAHSWNGGEVTKQAKCNEEGVKTYTCTAEGCGKTKEEPVAKSAHRYDDGIITKMPDFLMKGIKTLTCLYCKTEKTESVEAHADFSEQYYTTLTEQTNWLYGYANSFDAQTGAVDFVRIEQSENEKWKAENTEIGKGYVYSENNAVIAYCFNQTVPQSVQANISISYASDEVAAVVGAVAPTAFNAYLIIHGECVSLNKNDARDWSYQSEKAFDIAQGDILYLVLENSGEGYASGDLDFTITAPCVHVWDKGTVTKEATCTEEGVKEYSCVSCDKKITEAVEMIPHDYDEGEVTVEPTEMKDGVRTYTCNLCKGTKTETIPKLPSSLKELANFFDDFSTEGNNGWVYGYASDYQWDSNNFTFNPLNKVNDDEWGGKSGIIIKRDWLLSEWTEENQGNANAAIGYKVPAGQTKLDVAIKFEHSPNSETDGASPTRFSVRLLVVGSDDNTKTMEFINENASSWDVKRTVDVAGGDTVYAVLFREAGDWAQGKLQMVISGEEISVAPEFEGASFAEDFELNESGEFAGWQVGVIDYHWSSESFDFSKISALNENGDAYHSNDPWIDIKGDWMAVNGMMGFAYHFTSAANMKVVFNLHAVSEDGKFSLRWAIKDKDGNIKNADGHAQYVTGGHDIEFSQDITVVAGDVLYLLVNKDEGGDQNTFDITLTSNDKKSETEFNSASLKDDFTLENNPNGGWSYGSVDYHFGDVESIDFTAATEKGEWGWIVKDGDQVVADIRGDYLVSQSGFAAIAYKFDEDVKVNVEFKFKGNGPDETEFNIRIGVTKANGEFYANPEFRSGHEVEFEKEYEFRAGDTIYFIIEHKSGWDAGVPEITLTKAE